jgi:hypothetical protein
MADLSKDDRLADLLADLLIRQDRHEAKLDIHTELLRELLSSNRELIKVVSNLATRLTDNGTHEVRITDLERSVFGEKRPPEKKPSGPKPKPKAKGK